MYVCTMAFFILFLLSPIFPTGVTGRSENRVEHKSPIKNKRHIFGGRVSRRWQVMTIC